MKIKELRGLSVRTQATCGEMDAEDIRELVQKHGVTMKAVESLPQSAGLKTLKELAAKLQAEWCRKYR